MGLSTRKSSPSQAKPAKASSSSTRATAKKPATVRSRQSTSAQTQILAGKVDAIDRVQAVIEFELDGTIVTANENFLRCTNYRLEEIQGKHHRMFVDDKFADSREYQTFWENLRRGEFESGDYRRLGKGSKEIWLHASYNPIFDRQGNVIRVIKFATDITLQKNRNADYEGQLQAISKSQAIIEFDLHGNILTANENFCKTMGYELADLQGKSHRIFCEPEYANSSDYVVFWKDLREGKSQIGQFKRFRKDGSDVWIQASYNSNFDASGQPVKVVKYATDITAPKKLELQVAEKLRLDSEANKQMRIRVAQLLECVNAVAAGNIAVEFPDLGTDAIGQVTTALAAAIGTIRKSLVEFSQVTSTVTNAAEQLTAASREISSGAQTQASSLEETASSLEEITSTVKQNTDNAQQARQLAVGSRDIAEKGGAVVADAVTAMAGINHSSKKIADIITTIDEIAFQTNLLALNAAVEAARAGEQGRGFAVVAAEVRNLAQRSANAAREIKSLIEDSVNRVENGTQLVNKSGETLNEIVNSVKRVTDIVAEIAAASKEQLTGIEQVNKAVTQMDRVTQANAAQTEEVSSTAASLLSHAEQLREELARFELGSDSAVPVAKPPRSPRAADASDKQPAPNVVATNTFEFDQVEPNTSLVMEF